MLRSCDQHRAAATSRLQLRVGSFTLFVLSPTGGLAATAIVGESQPLTALINLNAGSKCTSRNILPLPSCGGVRRPHLLPPPPLSWLGRSHEHDLVHAADGLTSQHAATVLQPQPGASPARSMLTSRHTIVPLPRLQLRFTLNDVLVYVESSFFFKLRA